jgi:hypothetical protein
MRWSVTSCAVAVELHTIRAKRIAFVFDILQGA